MVAGGMLNPFPGIKYVSEPMSSPQGSSRMVVILYNPEIDPQDATKQSALN
jgi:hypothetical protein